MTEPEPQRDPHAPSEQGDQFQLTKGWLVVGIVAVVVGLVSGLIMSSAVFVR